MGEIVSAVERVTGIMSDIAAASQEQLAGIQQVAHAVSQMDRVTQQNAALVGQSAAAAENMADQADRWCRSSHASRSTRARHAAKALPRWRAAMAALRCRTARWRCRPPRAWSRAPRRACRPALGPGALRRRRSPRATRTAGGSSSAATRRRLFRRRHGAIAGWSLSSPRPPRRSADRSRPRACRRRARSIAPAWPDRLVVVADAARPRGPCARSSSTTAARKARFELERVARLAPRAAEQPARRGDRGLRIHAEQHDAREDRALRSAAGRRRPCCRRPSCGRRRAAPARVERVEGLAARRAAR